MIVLVENIQTCFLLQAKHAKSVTVMASRKALLCTVICTLPQ